MAPDSASEEAAGDLLAAYVATVPRTLHGDAWARWRRKNPPPYLRPGARRHGRCTLCGGELGAVLNYCYRCGRREFELLRALPPTPRPRARAVPATEGRSVREERRDYPAESRHRPACSRLWYVVVDGDGVEVTRSLKREEAERFL
jgi:hypothetical protein